MNSSKEALFEAVSSRKIPFVFWTGAGVSSPLPSWSQLLEKLIEVAKQKSSELSDPHHIDNIIKDASSASKQKNMWQAFDRLIDAERGIGGETFTQTIRTELGRSLTLPPPEVQQKIWELRPKGVVSLNLDHFTLRSAASSQGNIVPITIFPEQFSKNSAVFKEERPFIAYPHGYLDAVESWTFTSSKLNARLSDEGYKAWINTLFASTTVVFIGITADDIAVGSLLNNLIQRGISLSGHFWITSRNDSETDEWSEKHGIRVVRYESVGHDHSKLTKLLDELLHFKTPESTELERPVISQFSSELSVIPAPDLLDLRDKEKLRAVLNTRANAIFSITETVQRDKMFATFLKDYEDAVLNAYHASLSEGKNVFFGMYLAEKCGQGAFGTVYKAYTSLGEAVAIKILHAQNFEKPEFYKNFRRGVNALKIIEKHAIQGVVKLQDAYEIPPALVMEWVDGSTLEDVVRQNRLTNWHARIQKLLELAKILSKSHNLPEIVLHRDLRPANIMLRDVGEDAAIAEVVVLDFDLSWHKGAEGHSVMHSPALGYLAPEQRRKKAGVNTRSTLVDSYGFGMTLYFACTGCDPIPDQHQLPAWGDELIALICKTSCFEWKSLPKRIARLIQGCTREEQAQRLDFSQITGELESLALGLDDPENIASIPIIVEELATRTEYFRGYAWDSLTSSAALNLTEALAFKISADIPDRVIRLDINWRNVGTQDWRQIEKLLDVGLPKLLDSLRANGWIAKMSKESRSFSITARISSSAVSADIQSISAALDSTLNHASNASGYR